MTLNNFPQKWLSIIGIGEDGLAGLNNVARSLLDSAEVIVGGDRHLAMLPDTDHREKLVWTSPIKHSIAEIIQRRGQSVCVLASGDPMCYGIGVTLIRYIPIDEMSIIPAPSTFSLMCARLGWSLTEVELLSLCGRDPTLLHAFVYPHARLLILSADKQTPATVAEILVTQGYSQSEITVLEHLGGEKERIIPGVAATWDAKDVADLNAIACYCIPDSHTIPLSRVPGLPDLVYHHDGQLTKKEIRAITLAVLAPLPGQLLWDVGAGCGSIGIEWMRSERSCRAVAIEQNRTRIQYIADNAAALGVPNLQIVAGKAPTILKDLPQPDTIFIGGGLTTPNLLETCWNILPAKGRLVANAVTVESEQKLLQWQGELGGELTRIAISRAEPVGKFFGWKAIAPVTQWVVVK
ncbi:precorrin-6Y C5,15-methyltransferase (decarboxylating) [Stanieria cyanosphaera PCC 7437]|uniref:Precorrin-6Y C5,15-methyltransferase (Decarboxylating) n=1 Tax=Stanieria cyanosphaera (strain ATCC 29371 / PCC 7437) TaxID=111780 RepID=K9XQ52_STAC7|nr:bifunctional cobalt-precorrin-7 (C(5))-methyltransferase/cobalt-precorrin-6B (C(15))-methyltransferase [Stanieria cyanosphaera]AFZ34643.1 precorrin-6Y C5,15-methyltransferase (decarboxylating) [Stanieria cyanosphaera PCC 7437]